MPRKSRKMEALKLAKLAERPENLGRAWTWESIAEALDCKVGVAHEVIYYLRNNDDGSVWTVGTYKDGYVMTATQSLKVALPGLVNQLSHARTRDLTMAHQFRVLAKVDPDEKHRRAADRLSRYFDRRSSEVKDQMEALGDLVGAER